MVIVTVSLVQRRSRETTLVQGAAPVPNESTTNVFSEDELVVTEFTEPSADKDGFISLFNGRDLSGRNYNPQVWSVTNGVICARAPSDSRQTVHYLAWAGGEVADFELRLKFRMSEGGNSGIPIRARWPQRRWMPGYQAEILGQRSGLLVIAGSGNERPLSSAGFVTVAREVNGDDVLEVRQPLADAAGVVGAQAAVVRGKWCDMSITAQGRHFVIRLDGVTISDTRDEHPKKFVSHGALGLEYSHKQAREDTVEFKEIWFKRITAPTP